MHPLQLKVTVARTASTTDHAYTSDDAGNRRRYAAQILDFYGLPHPAFWKDINNKPQTADGTAIDVNECRAWLEAMPKISVKAISERLSCTRKQAETFLKQLEEAGIIEPAEPFKPRKIIPLPAKDADHDTETEKFTVDVQE